MNDPAARRGTTSAVLLVRVVLLSERGRAVLRCLSLCALGALTHRPGTRHEHRDGAVAPRPRTAKWV